MGLSENLTEIKSEVESLTIYANGVTGASDARLGDAVRTLASGFGSGSGGGSSITNSRQLMVEYFKKLGFVFGSPFNPYDMPYDTNNNYRKVEYNLDYDPTDIVSIYIDDDIDESCYYMGYSYDKTYSDSDKNRTFVFHATGFVNALINPIVELRTVDTMFAINGTRTQWNAFYTPNTAEKTIGMRVSNDSNNVRPNNGLWVLGVR